MGAYGTNKWQRDVRAGLLKHGIEVVNMEHRRKHISLRCKANELEWTQTISVSPSSPVALQQVMREAMGYKEGRIVVPHREAK